MVMSSSRYLYKLWHTHSSVHLATKLFANELLLLRYTLWHGSEFVISLVTRVENEYLCGNKFNILEFIGKAQIKIPSNPCIKGI